MLKRKFMIYLSLFAIATLAVTAFLNFVQRDEKSSRQLNDMLFVQQTQVSSFDPMDAFHEAHINLVRQIFQTLTPPDMSNSSGGSLSSSWSSVDGGSTWIVNLDKGYSFPEDECSPARVVNSNDVIYTFERLLDGANKSLGAVYFSDLIDFEEYQAGRTNLNGVTSVDQSTVKFELSEPDQEFPARLSLPYTAIVKKEAIECPSLNPKLNPVGSGAYSLDSYMPDVEVVLKARSNDLEFDTVSIQLIVDETEPLRRYKANRLDVAQLTPGTLRQLDQDLEDKVQVERTSKAYFFLVNLETIPNTETRRAISRNFNRQEFSETLGPLGEIAESLFPSSIFVPEKPNDVLVYGEVANQQITDESLSQPLRIITFDDILSRALGAQLQKDLSNIGLESELEHATFAVLVERLLANEYDLIQLYWGMLYNDAVHFLEPLKRSAFPPAGNNFNEFSDPVIEDAIERLKSSPVEERNQILADVEGVFFQQSPWIMTHYENMVRLKRFDNSSLLDSLGIRNYAQ